jgi:hypothetical protein
MHGQRCLCSSAVIAATQNKLLYVESGEQFLNNHFADCALKLMLCISDAALVMAQYNIADPSLYSADSGSSIECSCLGSFRRVPHAKVELLLQVQQCQRLLMS